MNIFLDNVPVGTTIGIDLNHFQLPASQPFHGFKHIPKHEGNTVHILHFQRDESGIRYGYWINSDRQKFINFQFDPIREIMVPQLEIDNNSAVNKFDNCQHLMVEYPSNEYSEEWQELVKYIRWKEVRLWCESEFNSESYVYVDSSMTSMEEANMLQKRVGDVRHNMILAPTDEITFRYTPIRFKDPESMRPEFKMQDFLDKSWYLMQVILIKYHYSNLKSLFGELQFSYLNSILFANYGSSLQWHNIIELVCFSDCLTEGKYKEIMEQLDSLLCTQMKRIPEEYREFLINIELLQKCVRRSKVPLPSWKTLIQEQFLNETYIEEEDQDHEGSYNEDDNEDENEYAPAIASQVVYTSR
ncbi:U5 snRNP complex subunit AAR2 [Kluyveromyces lactis]|uniref:KLLA0E20505p n=1 Tax=Kluyveromyces lactis (strain ATCC 8585 / CBS 2359 / DSM 70799 / NBRC 1267 / NRRL Y-1140 / WM37) TaxID=284590 RepID=Q6CMG2_KLULA|nr:uncharacterized protein KLLA0_E20505g [Kluyveromyces lactis]CAG99964.1 KLLA0E20505p [Kluyveromyces lactis]|eukprot:XP_454877.1 uncharacterized protein KLLA0_E20505g [Kluyveromyces lactis]